MSSEAFEKIKDAIAEALAGDPDSFTVELSREAFGELGAALDETTALSGSHGFNLSRVRVQGRDWIATYAKPRS